MHLDWFLPMNGGRDGRRRLRRALGRLGPTWASAPIRRIVQSACFVLFLVLFFWVSWPYGAEDYTARLAGREKVPAEAFLLLDPLVGLSTAIAARMWIAALIWTGGILVLCLFIPRGFCGYLCPLGTLIDCVDWIIGKARGPRPAPRRGGWIHLKYYLLSAILVSSAAGVLLSGVFAAIPVLTRGLLFTLAPLQLGVANGFYLVPPMDPGQWLSIALFIATLALGLLGKRFWCRYLCPTGAVFSLANFARVTQRKVETSCIDCGKCTAICPFDAIRADYTTRTADCTLCQTCGGVCPTRAIKFVPRWENVALKPAEGNDGVNVSRRGVLIGGAVGAAYAAGAGKLLAKPATPVRPPGSVPEEQFLQLCIRCGACFKVCPNNVLHPAGLQYGPDLLWTPIVVADWSGCSPSCSNCGQVCPTGAIRPLPIEEKRAARMALAILDEKTCLPYAATVACQLCVDECTAAGYNAMEFRHVDVQVDAEGFPIEGTGRLVPVVLSESCVGCGLCQTRCHGTNVKQKGLLRRSAIVIHAGEGREDRLLKGSYIELRRQRQAPAGGAADSYLPDFMQ